MKILAFLLLAISSSSLASLSCPSDLNMKCERGPENVTGTICKLTTSIDEVWRFAPPNQIAQKEKTILQATPSGHSILPPGEYSLKFSTAIAGTLLGRNDGAYCMYAGVKGGLVIAGLYTFGYTYPKDSSLWKPQGNTSNYYCVDSATSCQFQSE